MSGPIVLTKRAIGLQGLPQLRKSEMIEAASHDYKPGLGSRWVTNLIRACLRLRHQTSLVLSQALARHGTRYRNFIP